MGVTDLWPQSCRPPFPHGSRVKTCIFWLRLYVYLVRSLVQVAASALEAREYVGCAADVEWCCAGAAGSQFPQRHEEKRTKCDKMHRNGATTVSGPSYSEKTSVVAISQLHSSRPVQFSALPRRVSNVFYTGPNGVCCLWGGAGGGSLNICVLVRIFTCCACRPQIGVQKAEKPGFSRKSNVPRRPTSRKGLRPTSRTRGG